MMIALQFAGKPVVQLDETDGEAPLSISDHCAYGVMELFQRINPKLTDEQAEGIAFSIHYAIEDYLKNSFAFAVRAARKGVVRSLTRVPASPIGPLRRMKDAARREDFHAFVK